MSDNNFNKNDESEESIQEQLKTKKERKKEQRQLGKKYIKAQYNYHIGYRIKAFSKFIKQNTKYFFVKYIKAIMVALCLFSIVCLIIGIMNLFQGYSHNNEINKYKTSNKNLVAKEKSLASDAQDQSKKIDSKSVSTQTGVQRAKNVIDDVFKGMYQYTDADEYENNRNNNLKHFKNPDDKQIQSIYTDAKDSDGDSQIDILNLESDLETTDIFTKNPDDTKEKIVPFKAIVSYTGYINDVSSEYATRTHYTTYEIKFDTSTNKITEMKKVNSVKVNNDIS